MKDYKSSSWNQTCILNIFALVISYSSHETKTTKLQPKIERIYRIFLPWWGDKMKNYKTTSWNRTCILNIFALVISNSSHETKTTKLQPKIEHIYRIFLPWSGVKMKNYKTTSWNRTCILNIFALVMSYSSHETKTTKLQPKIEHIYRIFWPW